MQTSGASAVVLMRKGLCLQRVKRGFTAALRQAIGLHHSGPLALSYFGVGVMFTVGAGRLGSGGKHDVS